jgi:hypothetical protein
MMKLLSLILASFTWVPFAGAVEFVTLTANTPSKVVAAGSLVEVVGTNKNNDGYGSNLNLTFADGASARMVLRGKESSAYADMKGNVFTGVTGVTLEQTGGAAPATIVTLKITPPNEIGVTPPGAVLVLPEDATGTYTVITESSNDLVNWTTMTTTPVQTPGGAKFFRSRIVKTAP